jgi:hypothetical protein
MQRRTVDILLLAEVCEAQPVYVEFKGEAVLDDLALESAADLELLAEPKAST